MNAPLILTIDDMIVATRNRYPLSSGAEAAARDEHNEDDMIACHKCAIRWPTSLIDSKPPLEKPWTMLLTWRLHSPDYTVMNCPVCYGPGWCSQ